MSTKQSYIAEPLTGSCLCGSVSITIDNAHREVDVCHCTMCQTWGGSMYAGIEAGQFTITGQEHITAYPSSNWAERAFCSKCGSHLWYKFTPTGNRTFLAGLFDLPDEMAIKQQIFIDEKPHWFDLAQDSPKKTGAEIIEEAKAAGFSFD
ncbi:GFA family protein [Erythrobacter sp. SCSIO 43205]|uniref:GFA family protein n=1 Tax=Erythrobacter sp. SCSIO 43205 TaxID=2779361 RepID=UPI001CA8A13D|nr:GFA family protein [Erythrobacter sp. SCSIO 43205]UAB76796.1 GFA family protein [Erythrobacter sp. SCSIO 43205]